MSEISAQPYVLDAQKKQLNEYPSYILVEKLGQVCLFVFFYYALVSVGLNLKNQNLIFNLRTAVWVDTLCPYPCQISVDLGDKYSVSRDGRYSEIVAMKNTKYPTKR